MAPFYNLIRFAGNFAGHSRARSNMMNFVFVMKRPETHIISFAEISANSCSTIDIFFKKDNKLCMKGSLVTIC